MKLYLFRTSVFSLDPKLTMEEFEVVEKPKTYMDEKRRRRFNKEDVERVSGYGMNECLLLENNPSKAAEILLKQKDFELEELNKKVSKKKLEIENLKKYIK